MCKYIGMEYFAAASLITCTGDCISFADLKKKEINSVKRFKDNNIAAVILYSDYYTREMLMNFSDCFEISDDGKSLKTIVPKNVLISRFLSYLSPEILKTLMDGMKVA